MTITGTQLSAKIEYKHTCIMNKQCASAYVCTHATQNTKK